MVKETFKFVIYAKEHSWFSGKVVLYNLDHEQYLYFTTSGSATCIRGLKSATLFNTFKEADEALKPFDKTYYHIGLVETDSSGNAMARNAIDNRGYVLAFGITPLYYQLNNSEVATTGILEDATVFSPLKEAQEALANKVPKQCQKDCQIVQIHKANYMLPTQVEQQERQKLWEQVGILQSQIKQIKKELESLKQMQEPKLVCPQCNGIHIVTEKLKRNFRYGEDEVFEVEYPIHNCSNAYCGHRWQDQDVEDKITFAKFGFEISKGIVRTKFRDEEEQKLWEQAVSLNKAAECIDK